ncbi:hypothetical protein I4U23_003006 [Adineta vaga]|nr:hypothetical protein I4U23_003006 [Adineta vaga]
MASCMALKRSFDHDRDSSNTSPFESRTSTPSNKRQRRFFPMTIVSSPTAAAATTTTMTNETIESTVFPDVQPISTADVLLTRIKEEVRRLQRRHQMKLPTTSDQSDDDTTMANQNEIRSTTNQQHLLTLKQVNMICERLLKEREEKIREEYDTILTNKLNEQYEGFVRFTQDQLTRRFSELQFSYVS